MKRISTFILAFVFSFSFVSCRSAPTWQEQYDLGVKYLSEGNYEEAIIAFTAAIEINPKQAMAYIGRGDSYACAAESDEAEVKEFYNSALSDYLTAIDLDAQLAEAYKKAARIYVQLGDIESAYGLLNQGIGETKREELSAELETLAATNWNKTYMSWSRMLAYNADGTLNTYLVSQRDENGNVVSWQQFLEDSMLAADSHCVRDEYGRLVRTIQNAAVSNEQRVTEYSYDEYGHLSWNDAEIERDSFGRVLREFHGNQQNNYFYDDAGRMSRGDVYYDGELIMYLLVEYDAP